MRRSVSSRVSGAIRRILAISFLRRPLFFLVQLHPRLGRWAASKIGFKGQLIEQVLLGKKPPEWAIDPDPAAIAAWLSLLSDGPDAAAP